MDNVRILQQIKSSVARQRSVEVMLVMLLVIVVYFMYILPEDGHRSGPKHVVSSAQSNRTQKTLLRTVVLRKSISIYSYILGALLKSRILSLCAQVLLWGPEGGRQLLYFGSVVFWIPASQFSRNIPVHRRSMYLFNYI
jgi:Ca2+/Na+ antiporter